MMDDKMMDDKMMDDKMMDDKMMVEKQSMMFVGGIDISMAAPVEGSPNAPVTIIEFGDYQCPKCDQWFLNEKPTVTKEIIETGKAKIYFLDFPFLGDNSESAAQAAHCAGDQDMYHQYHSMLYTNQRGINDGWASPSELKKFASELNLDTNMFDECLDSAKYVDRISYNKGIGASVGVEGTPTFFIVSADGEVERIDGPQPSTIFVNIVSDLS
jgi:protein-disulfide isomerase